MSMNRSNPSFGKWLHFVDTAETDENLFPTSGCEMIEITGNTNVRIWFEHSGDNATHYVDLTTNSNKADEVGLIMADYIWGANTGRSNVYKFVAGSGRLTDVTTISCVDTP